jgi:NitT/TauT family transport system permease protein
VIAKDAAPTSAPPSSDAWQRYGYAILGHLILLAGWQAAVVFGRIPVFVLPSPAATLRAFIEPNYRWGENMLATAMEVFGGYGIAVVTAILLAMVFCWFRRVEMLVMPVLISLNMIPKVALGPLIIVWFKYGIGPNILITFTICFFPIVLTTSRGLREVEPDLLDLVRSLKGSRWQAFSKIQLPGALPYVFSGMKVGAILAVVGAVVGEFLGSDRGLGYLMMQVQVNLDTPAIFMALLLITAIGIALYGLVLFLERLVVPRDARIS